MDPKDTNILEAWNETLADTGMLLQQCLIQHYAILLENTDTVIASLQALLLDTDLTPDQLQKINALEQKLGATHTQAHTPHTTTRGTDNLGSTHNT